MKMYGKKRIVLPLVFVNSINRYTFGVLQKMLVEAHILFPVSLYWFISISQAYNWPIAYCIAMQYQNLNLIIIFFGFKAVECVV